jgi:hypothetical protein
MKNKWRPINAVSPSSMDLMELTNKYLQKSHPKDEKLDLFDEIQVSIN